MVNEGEWSVLVGHDRSEKDSVRVEEVCEGGECGSGIHMSTCVVIQSLQTSSAPDRLCACK